MRTSFIAAAAALVTAGSALAQSIEFRIVEHDGRTTVSGPGNAALNLAVQARVVGAAPSRYLAAFGFNIHIVGEPEGNGTLARLLTSNADHTYATTVALSNAIGRGGLAVQYSYLAAVNPGFNGTINASVTTFTNTPDQEIGVVAGSSLGSSLLGIPGMDTDADGNPDTWPANGAGTPPQNNVGVTLDPAVINPYLGSGGNWVDLYRFRYTLTNFSSRTLLFRVERPEGEISTAVMYQVGLWGARGDSTFPVSATDLSIQVAPTGAGSCCDTTTGACSIVAGPECAGAFFAAASCTPTACPAVGRCCDLSGACFTTIQTYCNASWSQSGSCIPSTCAQPSACCDASGVCAMKLATVCTGQRIAGAACSPSPCPSLGRCCSNTNACSTVSQFACASTATWTAGAACAANPCPLMACCGTTTCIVAASCSTGYTSLGVGSVCTNTLGPTCPVIACCNPSTGACLTYAPTVSCPAGTTFGGPNSSCSPNVCPQIGRCCDPAGTCSITLASACSGFWAEGGTCFGIGCPALGACCSGAGGCSLSSAALCSAAFHPALACGTAANPIGCCPANFNRVNGLDAQDIYDFLAAWFAHDPRADFDASGSFSVADITSFIGAWSAGCR